VDDDPQQQELVKEMLGREGYAVAGFASGEEALSFLCMNCADVLLLDLILAEEDGLAVCRKVRAMPNCQDLPIVFLSGIGQDQIVEQALALGAADYLLKPVKPADLVARVRCLARLGQVRREHAALEQEFRALSRVGPGPLPKGKQT
jgi:DNA-binding response OmpR family regulator